MTLSRLFGDQVPPVGLLGVRSTRTCPKDFGRSRGLPSGPIVGRGINWTETMALRDAKTAEWRDLDRIHIIKFCFSLRECCTATSTTSWPFSWKFRQNLESCHFRTTFPFDWMKRRNRSPFWPGLLIHPLPLLLLHLTTRLNTFNCQSKTKTQSLRLPTFAT